MRHDAIRLSCALAALCLPAAAMACGGFFCNNAQPVIQAGERILFAADGAQTEMHVQIVYDGPPSEFGWLLPAPPDVDVGLSSQALFPALDTALRPRFNLTARFADCGFAGQGGAGGAGGFGGEGEGEGEGEGPGVDVLERRALGPFDQAIIRADDVDALVEWLDENGFQRPAGAEAILADYVDTSVFVALKLLADADVRDIRPIRFRYSAPTMAVPLRPTSVAASRDMGVLIYVLGEGRAVPTNYLHVEINPALLDWDRGASNYVDLVSAAVDEAGGRAFVTDMSGPHRGQFAFEPANMDLDGLAALEDWQGIRPWVSLVCHPDVAPAVERFITPPAGMTAADIADCSTPFPDQPVLFDGVGLVAHIRDEVLPVWRGLDGLFEALPDVTRLFTTMSPDEMIIDPMFALNRDLPDVPANREALVYVGCMGDRTVEVDGLRYDSSGFQNGGAVQRQDGETVRGEGPMALRVERMMAAGPPETVTENADLLAARFQAPLPPEFGPQGAPVPEMDIGCACDAADGGLPSALTLVLLGLIGLGRRASVRRGDPSAS